MYKDQVALLLSVIQDTVADERVAVKGGTAINLFLENMPRFSVDIDLCYLPNEERTKSLSEINTLMNQIASRVSKKNGILTQINKTTDGIAKQVQVKKERTSIKIEINHVLRGHVYETQTLALCSKAQEVFKTYAEIRALSTEEVYAGKFCATLDRQHPRDLFDVMNFYKKHEHTEKMKKAFLIYLISGNRPVSEMINPRLLDQKTLYERELKGMTDNPLTYEELERARKMLIDNLDSSLNQQDREFLISFKRGEPLWNHLNIEHAKDMSAIKWKLFNIAKMHPEKHQQAVDELARKLKLDSDFPKKDVPERVFSRAR